MAISDIRPELPTVGIPSLEQRLQAENMTVTKIALLDHESRIETLEGSGAISDLDTLSDVTITSPLDGQSLVYDSGTWVNQTPAGGGDMLESIYDPQTIQDDAFARANHTGEQAISTVTGLQTALDGKLDDSEVGTGNNQLVRLDGSARLPAVDGSQLTNLAADVSGNFTAKGSLLAGTGSGTFGEFAAGTDGQVPTYDSGETTGLAKRSVTTLADADAINRNEIDYAADLIPVWDDSASKLKGLPVDATVDAVWSEKTDVFTVEPTDYGVAYDLQSGAEAGGTVNALRDGQVAILLNRSGSSVGLSAGTNVTLTPSSPSIGDGLMAFLICRKPSTQSLVYVAVQAAP